jgi:glycosyltransferase involved in cell wall biosynthesis
VTRVLLVSHYYPPHVGGVENVVHQEATRLVATGVEVTVLTSGPHSRTTVEEGVRVVRVGSWNGFEPHGIPFPVPWPTLYSRARKWARWADVVHVHDSFYLTSWAAWFGSATTGTPLVATQHVAMSEHPVRAVELIQKLVYAVIGKRVIRRARAVFTINTRGADFARGLGANPEAVRHLPNGVDVELFHPADPEEMRKTRAEFGLPEDAVLVLFVGRLLAKKGLDLLLEARDPAYRLVFVGPGDTTPLDGLDDVHYLGSRAPAELARIYRACDIFALPTGNEGFPLTVQEAMSSGLPVLTTDDPAYASYNLDRDRMALTPRETAAVRDRLREIALDAGLRGTMGGYTRAYAEKHFAWTEHVAVLLECYRSAARHQQ